MHRIYNVTDNDLGFDYVSILKLIVLHTILQKKEKRKKELRAYLNRLLKKRRKTELSFRNRNN